MGQALEPLFTTDDAGRVTSWGESAARLFGRSADAALGEQVVEAVRGADGTLRVVLRSEAEGGGWEVFPGDGADHAADDGAADGDVEGPLVRALFSVSQLGLLVVDRDLRLIRVSAAAGSMHGSASEELLGRRLDEVYRLADPVGDLAAARSVLETGTSVFSRLVTVLGAAWVPAALLRVRVPAAPGGRGGHRAGHDGARRHPPGTRRRADGDRLPGPRAGRALAPGDGDLPGSRRRAEPGFRRSRRGLPDRPGGRMATTRRSIP